MKNIVLWGALGWASIIGAQPAFSATAPFSKVMIVVFENTDYQQALNQPMLGKLAHEGALLTNFGAEGHPSQGNYIALTAGNNRGVLGDSPVTLDVKHIGDLLEAKGKTWKIYLEGYPGNCFSGATSGKYARKHNPFMSFKNIQQNPARCNAHLVNASVLAQDVQNGTVPDYSLYIPDLNNDGHDTNVTYADNWFAKAFVPLLNNPSFMQGMVLIATFDESSYFGGNHIYTALYGSGVVPGSSSNVRYDHYSILRTVEEAFGLGSLGQNDVQAPVISGIWK